MVRTCSSKLDFGPIRSWLGLENQACGGFINHLDSREVALLLSQSIAIEARQEQIFRQMSGLHPMPVWFEAGTLSIVVLDIPCAVYQFFAREHDTVSIAKLSSLARGEPSQYQLRLAQ